MNDSQPIRVLLADDDQFVLECYRKGLGPHEHPSEQLSALSSELFGPGESEPDRLPSLAITTCNQGDHAVRLFRLAQKQGQSFDVVVLDIRMPPGINGVTAASRIRALDSQVTIIFVSGYSDFSREDLMERLPPPKRLRYLPKPVRVSKLEATIRSVA